MRVSAMEIDRIRIKMRMKTVHCICITVHFMSIEQIALSHRWFTIESPIQNNHTHEITIENYLCRYANWDYSHLMDSLLDAVENEKQNIESDLVALFFLLNLWNDHSWDWTFFFRNFIYIFIYVQTSQRIAFALFQTHYFLLRSSTNNRNVINSNKRNIESHCWWISEEWMPV